MDNKTIKFGNTKFENCPNRKALFDKQYKY